MTTQSRLLNAILFQMMWFSAALLSDELALGVLGVLVVHFIWASHLARDLSLGKGFVVLVAFLIGLAIDYSLKNAGIYEFDTSRTWLGSLPVWLVIMWAGFSFTLYGSLEWLLAKPIAFVFCCAIFGPFSYWVGMNIGIVRFFIEDLVVISCLWIVWGAAVGFLHHSLNRMGLVQCEQG